MGIAPFEIYRQDIDKIPSEIVGKFNGLDGPHLVLWRRRQVLKYRQPPKVFPLLAFNQVLDPVS